MSTTPSSTELPPQVQRILRAVRQRVRAYFWLEGVATLVALLGVAFWAGMLGDWLFEPSPGVRRLGILGFAVLMVWALYHFLIRRLIAPVTDFSAAILLERRFPALADHLLTAVTLSSPSEQAAFFDPLLVDQTRQDAARAVAKIRPGDLFNYRPLVRAVTLASALIASVALFALTYSDTFGFWLQRLALSDQPWPRRVHLEVVGFSSVVDGERVHKLAQDENYELVVHASTDGFETPDTIEIRYQLADGRRGRDTMIRVGEAESGRDKFQVFRYEFKRVAANMTFDVVGGDDRVNDLLLHVVDRPELHAIELSCVYPTYLVRESRRLQVTGGMRIPEGTRLVLHAAATKPLAFARIHSSHRQRDFEVALRDLPVHELQWDYGTLTSDDVLLVTVVDADGVSCREPYRVSLTMVPDEVPQIAMRLSGIGTAATPDAILPLVGEITDDYGLKQVWFEYAVTDGPSGTRQLAAPSDGQVKLAGPFGFDLRGGDDATGPRAFTLQPGSKISLSLRAIDHYDLSNERRAGSSQSFSLDIVTVAQLLALIESRELTLRQRYEAIYEKVTDTRNLLARIEVSEPSEDESKVGSSDASTGDAEASSDQNGSQTQSPEVAPRRAMMRGRLLVARALQDIIQSGEEIIGVAEGFDDLHDQLTNNRIDNPDLKSRLREQIAEPLHRIGKLRMPKLRTQVELVEKELLAAGAAPAELNESLALADEILNEMRQVLERMRELQTYNEVVAMLRGIISDQDDVIRRTKEIQKERLRNLLE